MRLLTFPVATGLLLAGGLAFTDAAFEAYRGVESPRLALLLPLAGAALMAVAIASLWAEHRRRQRAEQALHEHHAAQPGVIAAAVEKAVAEAVAQAVHQADEGRTRELSEALERSRRFAADLDRSIEAERRRLAREVHDQLGQLGTAAKMLTLSMTRKVAPAKEPMHDEMLAIADEVIAAARRIAHALRPPLLDDFGFGAAAQHYAQGLQRQGDLVVDVDLAPDEALTPEQHNQLFRLLQEAATTALQHAQAQQLTIESRVEDGEYRLRIQDDGVGLEDGQASASRLLNMRERAVLAGGQMAFGPAPQRGTRIEVRVPLEAGVEALDERGGLG